MYKSLQAGRAFAAIFVVLFHLGGAIAAEKYFDLQFFSIPFSFGDSGVNFFFVLSGFIILTAHYKDVYNPRKIGNYLEKRIIRIYPTYWIIFLVVYLIAISSSALHDTVPHDFFVLFKSLLLIPQDKILIGGTGAPVLIVAWTLQYEVLFYSFFSLIILGRIISTILGLSWLCIYLIYHGSSSLTFPLSFLAKDYILLFFLGMSISVICTNKSSAKNIKKPIIYFFIGACIFTFIALNKIFKTDFLSDFYTIIYGASSALMIFGLVKTEDSGQVIGGAKWLQILGDSSYALYLIHYPLISILCKLAMLINLKNFGVIGALISFIFIFIICIFTSVIFNLWIEKPVTKYLRIFISRIYPPTIKAAPADARPSQR